MLGQHRQIMVRSVASAVVAAVFALVTSYEIQWPFVRGLVLFAGLYLASGKSGIGITIAVVMWYIAWRVALLWGPTQIDEVIVFWFPVKAYMSGVLASEVVWLAWVLIRRLRGQTTPLRGFVRYRLQALCLVWAACFAAVYVTVALESRGILDYAGPVSTITFFALMGLAIRQESERWSLSIANTGPTVPLGDGTQNRQGQPGRV